MYRRTSDWPACGRKGWVRAGLAYFNSHSIRNTLVQLGEKVCKSPEDCKAWSQNLGHEGVLTTFLSYGQVSASRQAEIMRGIGRVDMAELPDPEFEAKVLQVIRDRRDMLMK